MVAPPAQLYRRAQDLFGWLRHHREWTSLRHEVVRLEASSLKLLSRSPPRQGVFGFLICMAGLLSITVTSPVSHMFSSVRPTSMRSLETISNKRSLFAHATVCLAPAPISFTIRPCDRCCKPSSPWPFSATFLPRKFPGMDGLLSNPLNADHLLLSTAFEQSASHIYRLHPHGFISVCILQGLGTSSSQARSGA